MRKICRHRALIYYMISCDRLQGRLSTNPCTGFRAKIGLVSYGFMYSEQKSDFFFGTFLVSALGNALSPFGAVPDSGSLPQQKKRYTRLKKFRADYTPAVFAFVLHTGVKGEPVLTGDGKAAPVVIVDLRDGDHFISPCAELCFQRDFVADFQFVQLIERLHRSAIMPGQRDIAAPDAAVLEVADAFMKRVAVCSFVNLDRKVDCRDFQRSKMAVRVVHIRGHLRESAGRVWLRAGAKI